MANIINKNKENPKLLETSLKDGRISLYLEYYQGYTSYIDEATGKTKVKHSRRKETLNLYLIQNPKTPADRKTNEENIRIARDIRFQKEQEFKENRLGYKFRKETRINVFDFMHGFLANISNPRNRSSVKVPVMRFKEFIELEYPIYKDFLYPEQLNEDMIRKYCDYLRKKSKGTGAVRSYCFFKSIIKRMVKEKLLKENPCEDISIRGGQDVLIKEILTLEEIETLIKNIILYPIGGYRKGGGKPINMDVRRAFLFCCYTGIRFCDVKDLTYGNIDYSTKLLRFNQAKTKGHSSASWVTIPLNDSLLSFIGEGDKNDKIFNKLPSYVACKIAIFGWIKRVGINKHITWHVARHTFASLITLSEGVPIETVSKMLGHRDITTTQIYAEISTDKILKDIMVLSEKINGKYILIN